MALNERDLSYAVGLVETICWLAGTPDYLEDLKDAVALQGFFDATERQQSKRLFEWLLERMSFQGVSDVAAQTFMDRHGLPTWREISDSLSKLPQCPLLSSYWHFDGCGFRKLGWTCANPTLIDGCPLPSLDLRNGNLNQLAYSLFLFIRDIADGDLIGWIDAQLASVDVGSPRIAGQLREAVLEPLSNIHGISSKVLNMVMSDFLVAGSLRNERWGLAGGGMVAVDTLVHKFLYRSGVLSRANAEHAYGSQCYGDNGCAALIETISAQIDARQFNENFPQHFPRYIQKAIWRYCAQDGLSICNGHKVDDSSRCQNTTCRLFGRCDRQRPI